MHLALDKEDVSMPINIDFGVTAQALQIRAQRATMIANNIANADTPGYKSTDLDFRQVLANIADEQGMDLPGSSGGLATTNEKHFSDSYSGANQYLIDPLSPQYRIPSQPALDGNTVDTQVEKAEFAENQLRYEASVQFLDDKVSSLKRAFRGN
tara:strand:+ start:33598 stop:34059 length:462 start_codon:yes stop_codon:yes gene_type:complete